MEAHLLQDWICITGDSGAGSPKVTSIAQGADSWLDIAEYEDLVFYLEVKQVTGTVTMNYETAPTQQESSFLATVTPFTVPSSGVRVDQALFAYAPVPPARFVRWRLTAPGASGVWQATFRVWVAAYSFGD